MNCFKCKGVGWITPDYPVYFNCEAGGDYSKDNSNWTKENCKTCGKIRCTECNGE